MSLFENPNEQYFDRRLGLEWEPYCQNVKITKFLSEERSFPAAIYIWSHFNVQEKVLFYHFTSNCVWYGTDLCTCVSVLPSGFVLMKGMTYDLFDADD